MTAHPPAPAAAPPLKLDWSARRFSRCQADEDDCSYHACPRWRDGKLISDKHCALDLQGGGDDE